MNASSLLGASRSSRVVLVVDDDPFSQELLGEVCCELAVEVRTAGDGAQALEMLYAAQGGIDVVLLDINMPRIDGYGVLQRLHAEPLKNRPAIIIVTANADVSGRMRGLELGATDFLEKPFSASELQRRVARALNQKELEELLCAEQGVLATLRRTDPVTGAGTFGQLHEVLEAEFQCAVIGRRPLTCIVVSDERLSGCTEAQAHMGGHERLQTLSMLIGQRLRATDYIFRIDIAEFVILLPATDPAGAQPVVEKILATIETLAELSVGEFAFAVASYPHPSIRQASALFRAANLALAKARSQPDVHLAYFDGF